MTCSTATRLLLLAGAMLLLGAGDSLAQNRPVASPRDSAVATVDGAKIHVDYGRPSMRGRTIFGGLVPYDQVWRTGANQATHLVVDRDVVIGGTPVPAGKYTLYTIPGEKSWKLVINKQTGQWGTQYDAAQDLARIDMTVKGVSQPVEQFTIAVEPKAQGGALVLSWDRTQASVPITVKK